jgi:hypothetical protein
MTQIVMNVDYVIYDITNYQCLIDFLKCIECEKKYEPEEDILDDEDELWEDFLTFIQEHYKTRYIFISTYDITSNYNKYYVIDTKHQ